MRAVENKASTMETAEDARRDKSSSSLTIGSIAGLGLGLEAAYYRTCATTLSVKVGATLGGGGTKAVPSPRLAARPVAAGRSSSAAGNGLLLLVTQLKKINPFVM